MGDGENLGGSARCRAVAAELEWAESLLTSYRERREAALGEREKHWAREAAKRLIQLAWLLRELEGHLRIAHDEFARLRGLAEAARQGDPSVLLTAVLHAPAIVADAERQLQYRVPLETLTEAFYWVAFRARAAIRKLPELKRFEAAGVRNVRNHLLEHPEGPHSGVLINTFAYGGPEGPRVKGGREPDQDDRWLDAGLFANASEFAQELAELLEKSTPSQAASA